MANRKKSVHELSIEELDKELIVRGAQIPDIEKFNFLDKEGTPEHDAMINELVAPTKRVYTFPCKHNHTQRNVDY